MPALLDGIQRAPLLPRAPALHLVASQPQKRAVVQGIIPTYYVIDGPAPGTVVGITLGSVLGFLLVVWLIWSVVNNSNTSNGHKNTISGEEEIVVRRPRERRHSHSQAEVRRSRDRRSSHTEMYESPRVDRSYHGSPRMDRSPRRREQVIVEERRHARAPPRPRSFVVEERSRSRVPGDDVVEVITEHEDYRERRASRPRY